MNKVLSLIACLATFALGRTNGAETYLIQDGKAKAEIVYWERPEGGRVFHTGSIATAWAMYYDESLGKLVRNVLHHFKVVPKKQP